MELPDDAAAAIPSRPITRTGCTLAASSATRQEAEPERLNATRDDRSKMSETTRRTILTGAAGLGAAALLSACDPQVPGVDPTDSATGSADPTESPSASGDPGQPTSSASPTSSNSAKPTKTATESPSTTPSKSATPTKSATSKPTTTTPANAIARTKDIPVGGGKVFESSKVVVTQPKAGEFKAFSAVCTHQGCLVSSVRQNVIACPCHGSMFSAADGSVKGGPAPTALAAKKVHVEGDGIVLG